MENSSDSSPFGSSILWTFPFGKFFPKRESTLWKTFGRAQKRAAGRSLCIRCGVFMCATCGAGPLPGAKAQQAYRRRLGNNFGPRAGVCEGGGVVVPFVKLFIMIFDIAAFASGFRPNFQCIYNVGIQHQAIECQQVVLFYLPALAFLILIKIKHFRRGDDKKNMERAFFHCVEKSFPMRGKFAAFHLPVFRISME